MKGRDAHPPLPLLNFGPSFYMIFSPPLILSQVNLASQKSCFFFFFFLNLRSSFWSLDLPLFYFLWAFPFFFFQPFWTPFSYSKPPSKTIYIPGLLRLPLSLELGKYRSEIDALKIVIVDSIMGYSQKKKINGIKKIDFVLQRKLGLLSENWATEESSLNMPASSYQTMGLRSAWVWELDKFSFELPELPSDWGKIQQEGENQMRDTRPLYYQC